MKAIAGALGHLQGDKEYLIGEFILCIKSVKKKLEEVAPSTRLVYCQALSEGVVTKFEGGFSKALSFESGLKEDMLSCVSHPLFTLRWVPAEKRCFLQEMLATTFKEVFVQKKTTERLEDNTVGKQIQTEEAEKFLFNFRIPYKKGGARMLELK